MLQVKTNSKSKPKQPRRRRRGRRGRLRNNTPKKKLMYTVQEPGPQGSTSAQPASQSSQLVQSTTKQSGRVWSDEYGEGIRMSGYDMIATAGDRSGNNFIFSAYNSGLSGNSDYTLLLHPANFPRLFSVAQNYAKYTFRYVALEYCPGAPTSKTGNLAIGYSSDAGIAGTGATPSLTFARLLAYMGAKATSWFMKTVVKNTYVGKLAWPVFEATSSSLDYILRQKAQGVFIGLQDSMPSANVSYGNICCRYVIDLYAPILGGSSSSLLAQELTLKLTNKQIEYLGSKLREEREAKLAERRKEAEHKENASLQEVEGLLETFRQWTAAHEEPTGITKPPVKLEEKSRPRRT